jgi:hypothetical protein
LIAVGLEQTVEAVHHHRQREQLLVSLDHDTRSTLQDADFAAAERQRRMQWNQARIEQVRAALASHKPLAPAVPQKSAFITVPAEPAWEAARASGMITLFFRARSPPTARLPMSLAARDPASMRKGMLTQDAAILKSDTSR